MGSVGNGKVGKVVSINGRLHSSSLASNSLSSTSPTKSTTQPASITLPQQSFEVVDLHPNRDIPPNILYELTYNIESYIVNQRESDNNWVNMRSLPASVSLTIAKLQGRLKSSGRRRVAGKRTFLNCCIVNGLPIFSQHPNVRLLIECYDRFTGSAHLGVAEELFVFNYLRQTIPFMKDGNGGAVGINVPLSKSTKDSLAELAGTLGMTEDAVATISMFEFLLSHSSDLIPRSLLDKWEEDISQFYRLLGLKAAGANGLTKGLIEDLREMVEDPDRDLDENEGSNA